MGGTVRRQQKEQDRKRTSGIEQIETHIPSPKTTSCLQYVSHLEYMFLHMDALFGFYGFEAARIKWLNYVASQRSIEEAVNIFLNDVMASKNMFTIARSIWTGNDRPTVFQRQTATLNVVASAHSGESTA
ncbi:hypothetical protein MFLAVUS_005535 [Mucor flavus]|uniref:Uncharacterized protein n=1 Tax=Mucor flavus TaxID=439312 RepID=A0ABP9YYZ4_9FUNG